MSPASTILLCSVVLALPQGGLTLSPREAWTNLPADSAVTRHFLVRSPQPFKGLVRWTLADPATGRALSRGESAVELAADKPATIKIALDPTGLKVAWAAKLMVTVSSDGQQKPEASYEKILWILPPNPFADRQKWLTDLKITLYEPAPGGKTAKALQGLKIPHETVGTAAELLDRKQGLILVGEGASFREEPDLAETLIRAASRGRPVLCLAPVDGAFPLPGADNPLPAPSGVTLRGRDVITQLDRRLDADVWAPGNSPVLRSFEVRSVEEKVVLDVRAGLKGMSWLQLDYAGSKGRLVLSGFAVIRDWDAGPTPRYLLARMLEHVSE